jgi:hypothetical protein
LEKNKSYEALYLTNRSFKTVAKLKYFGTAATNRNCVEGEIKSRGLVY